ncbi:MAG: DNA polymerase/3'-5' exonuclease PolX [Chlamydiae bacterium]|nr:DNA polymerase/3'-5' exonuclease PolX [Chlamydiota bacterium]
MDKNEIAQILEEIATLLEIQDANPFRVRAYRNAARSLRNTERSLSDLIAKNALVELEGIGKDLAEKITTLAKKKKLPFYEELKKSIPKVILELIQIQGLGPKKANILYQKLKIHSVEDLKKACVRGRVSKLKGFGEKTAQNILDAISNREMYHKRVLWWEATQAAEPILKGLENLKAVKDVSIAGSLRRKLETIGDLDFLVGSDHPKEVVDWFTTLPEVAKILAKGEGRSSVKLKSGMQADLRIVPPKQFGFALCYFTGSKEHNIKIRTLSLKKGWSLSEYGFEVVKKGSPPSLLKGNATEKDIYKALSLSYIPPEMRENMGEVEAAAKGNIPDLINEKDLRGTFHNHTTASDGKNTLKEMLSSAQNLGWEYIGISDHSKSSFQANGLSVERLLSQVKEIAAINRSKQYKIHVFAGTECDILPNGNLDFPDDVLKKLDYVIVSVHSALSQDEKTMTKRIIKAIEHPMMTMLGHLTGRLLLRREGYKVDIEKVIDACIANKKIIEINGNPYRLDMDWRYWHKAKEKGLLTCINTDAHAISGHGFIRSGINVARKGWLEKKDVLNTCSLKEIQRFFKSIPKT